MQFTCLPFGHSSVRPEASSAGDGSFVETGTLLSGELRQKDLKWWTQNINSWNGRGIKVSPPDTIMEMDTFNIG